MGALALADATLAGAYGELAVRFNTLRQFYACVRRQINDHKTTDRCLGPAR